MKILCELINVETLNRYSKYSKLDKLLTLQSSYDSQGQQQDNYLVISILYHLIIFACLDDVPMNELFDDSVCY